MAVHFSVTGHDIGSRDGVAKRDGGLIARSRGRRARCWIAGMSPDGGKRIWSTRNVIHESALEIYRTQMRDRVGRARGSVRNGIRRSGREGERGASEQEQKAENSRKNESKQR